MPNKPEETFNSNQLSLRAGIPTLAGSFARVLAGYPLDTIAKNAQMQQGATNYASILRTLKNKTTQKKGIRKFGAFYPGFPIALVYKGTQLKLFELLGPLKESVKENISNPMAADLVSGGTMAGIQTSILHPLNPFRLRVQMGVASYTWSAFKTDIFSGLGATYGRNFVFLGTAAVVSTQLEKLMLNRIEPDKNGERALTRIQKENICSVSGAMAVGPCLPLDLLKTRRQTWLGPQPKARLSTMALQIVKQEGGLALFKGGLFCVAVEYLTISVYLRVKRHAENYLNEEPINTIPSTLSRKR